MTCEAMADRILDRLYGELAEQERPAFEAHLASCEGCRSQLSALERTRRSAQVALRGPLLQPAPERVHAAALAAAALRVSQRSATAAPIDARHARKSDPSKLETQASAGFWAWLRRPWFLPAFATVSLLAIFFIARPMLMDGPRRALQSELSETEGLPAAAPESIAEPAPAAQAVSAPPPASPPAEAKADQPERPRLDDRRQQRIAELRTQILRKSGPAPSRRLSAEPAKKMVAKNALDADLQAAAQASKEEEAEARLPSPRMMPARAEAAENRFLLEGAPAQRAADSLRRDVAPAEAPVKRQRFAANEAPPTRFTPPPPGTRVRARPYASASGMPAAPPPPAPVAASAERVAAAADESDAPAAGGAGRGATSQLGLDALIEKADRLFRAGQWQPAVDAYRELLRRFPSHERTPLWRQRVDVATRALTR
jgi:hypothetical protein